MAALLEVHDLEIRFPRWSGKSAIVDGLGFDVGAGEIAALVGASGAGKSLTALALLGLLPPPGRISRGSIRFRGRELRGLAEGEYRALRGGRIGFVPQEPATALTPVASVGAQLVEAVRAHRDPGAAEAASRAAALLERLALPAPRRLLRCYPHELSGGQRQRVLLALALAGEPELLIADEATSALDLASQAEILELLAELRRERGLAVLLIAHDLAAVGRLADRIHVLHGGRAVEQGEPRRLAAGGRHPYTRELFAAALRGAPAPRAEGARAKKRLLEVRDLRKEYHVAGGRSVAALGGVDLEVAGGEVLAVIGASGSGKTTLGRTVLRLVEPSSGEVRFRGEDLTRLGGRALRRRRRQLQMVFQESGAALNPRLRVGAAIFEPLLAHGMATRRERSATVKRLLDQVGLAAEHASRHPHELSGGERQRVVLARALATGPDLLVADEPVSALDALTRTQIVELLDATRRRGAALLLVAHDLELVRRLADRVAVLYAGRIVEEAPAEELVERPAHPYTVCLVSASPAAGGALARRVAPLGAPPDPASRAGGCAFHPRCPTARRLCGESAPALRPLAAGRRVACHFPGELALPDSPPARVEPFLPGDVK